MRGKQRTTFPCFFTSRRFFFEGKMGEFAAIRSTPKRSAKENNALTLDGSVVSLSLSKKAEFCNVSWSDRLASLLLSLFYVFVLGQTDRRKRKMRSPSSFFCFYLSSTGDWLNSEGDNLSFNYWEREGENSSLSTARVRVLSETEGLTKLSWAKLGVCRKPYLSWAWESSSWRAYRDLNIELWVGYRGLKNQPQSFGHKWYGVLIAQSGHFVTDVRLLLQLTSRVSPLLALFHL